MCVCAHRDDFTLENVEQESQARVLLDQTISLLQSISQQNASVVDRMKLMQISRNMVSGRGKPEQDFYHFLDPSQVSLTLMVKGCCQEVHQVTVSKSSEETFTFCKILCFSEKHTVSEVVVTI